MEISTLHSAKFAIDLESMLSIPASVFWKDIRGVYLGCNDVMAELASLSSRQAVVGIDDVELVGHDAAMIFIDHDREVIRSSTPRVVDEYFRNEQGSLIKGFSTKAPLFDQDGILVGLWGSRFSKRFPKLYSQILFRCLLIPETSTTIFFIKRND